VLSCWNRRVRPFFVREGVHLRGMSGSLSSFNIVKGVVPGSMEGTRRSGVEKVQDVPMRWCLRFQLPRLEDEIVVRARQLMRRAR
jgi:hypothetical protein